MDWLLARIGLNQWLTSDDKPQPLDSQLDALDEQPNTLDEKTKTLKAFIEHDPCYTIESLLAVRQALDRVLKASEWDLLLKGLAAINSTIDPESNVPNNFYIDTWRSNRDAVKTLSNSSVRPRRWGGNAGGPNPVRDEATVDALKIPGYCGWALSGKTATLALAVLDPEYGIPRAMMTVLMLVGNDRSSSQRAYWWSGSRSLPRDEEGQLRSVRLEDLDEYVGEGTMQHHPFVGSLSDIDDDAALQPDLDYVDAGPLNTLARSNPAGTEIDDKRRVERAGYILAVACARYGLEEGFEVFRSFATISQDDTSQAFFNILPPHHHAYGGCRKHFLKKHYERLHRQIEPSYRFIARGMACFTAIFGVQRLHTAGATLRVQLYTRLFDAAPYLITERLFAGLSQYLALDEVFNTTAIEDSDLRADMRCWYKHVFIHYCEVVWKQMIMEGQFIEISGYLKEQMQRFFVGGYRDVIHQEDGEVLRRLGRINFKDWPCSEDPTE